MDVFDELKRDHAREVARLIVAFAFVLTCFLAATAIACIHIGDNMGRRHAQTEAVNTGNARWVVDPETGVVYFEWRGK